MNDLDKVVEASPFLMITAILMFVLLIFLIIGYILMGISLYKINKNREHKGSWMAWVPIFNVYLLGKLGCNKIVGMVCSIAIILCTSFTVSINGIVKQNFSIFPTIISSIILIIIDILMIVSAAKLYKKAGKNPITLWIITILTLGMAIPFFLFSIRNENNKTESISHNLTENSTIEPVNPNIIEPINSIWQEKKEEEISPLPLPEINIENEPAISNAIPISSINEEHLTVSDSTPIDNPLPINQINSVSNPVETLPNEPTILPNNASNETIPSEKSNTFLKNSSPMSKEENQQPKQFMSVEELLNSQNFK